MSVRADLIGLGVVAVVLGVLVVGPAPPAGPGAGDGKTFPARVLIIRHAEKPTGRERAAALYKLFEKSDGRPDPFPAPDFVFATEESKNSRRPVETVTPLAE